MTSQRIAVLTGDLVHSTELGPEKIERAFKALKDCAQVQETWHGAPLHFTRHRGDGWQVALARPEMALRSALAFRAALKAESRELDSYIGIAEGKVTAPFGPDLNDETAEVFRRSGEKLDETKVSAPLTILHASGGAIEAAVILADAISQNWTTAQAAAILPVLAPDSSTNQTKVGKIIGKSRQAVAKAWEAGQFLQLQRAFWSIESAP